MKNYFLFLAPCLILAVHTGCSGYAQFANPSQESPSSGPSSSPAGQGLQEPSSDDPTAPGQPKKLRKKVVLPLLGLDAALLTWVSSIAGYHLFGDSGFKKWIDQGIGKNPNSVLSAILWTDSFLDGQYAKRYSTFDQLKSAVSSAYQDGLSPFRRDVIQMGTTRRFPDVIRVAEAAFQIVRSGKKYNNAIDQYGVEHWRTNYPDHMEEAALSLVVLDNACSRAEGCGTSLDQLRSDDEKDMSFLRAILYWYAVSLSSE